MVKCMIKYHCKVRGPHEILILRRRCEENIRGLRPDVPLPARRFSGDTLTTLSDTRTESIRCTRCDGLVIPPSRDALYLEVEASSGIGAAEYGWSLV